MYFPSKLLSICQIFSVIPHPISPACSLFHKQPTPYTLPCVCLPKQINNLPCFFGGFLAGSVVKNLPASAGDTGKQVWSLDWEDPLELFVVQSLSRVRLFVTPWTAALQASLSFKISWSLHKLMSIESVMPSNHLIHFISVVPFYSCLQSFPASGSFPMSQFFGKDWKDPLE